MTKNPIRRLTLRAHLNAYTGYGTMVCALFNELSKSGIYIAVRPTAIDEQWGKTSAIPLQMRAQIVTPPQPEDWELVVCTPDTFPTPRKKTAYFTMYECSKLPAQYVRNLNQAELVIVPCEWNKVWFKESGVRKPIHVCPLGYDPTVFYPTPKADKGPTVFGVAGRMRHCARRKGIAEAVDLFLKTFPKDPDVRLHVKIHPDDPLKAPEDPRVKIFKGHMEPYELSQWIAGLDCYVTLSRAEGFSLWPLQAMACGRAVIGASYSGQADFMKPSNSIIVKHREVEAVSGESNVEYSGLWAEVDLKSASEAMMRVREDRAWPHSIGAAAAQSIKGWTWENSAKKLANILKKAGALT